MSACICCFPLAAFCLVAAAQSGPELIVDIDVNDEVYIRTDRVMTAADVEELVDNLHRAGCTTIIVRAGYLGLLPYQTELSYPMRFDPEHAREHAFSMVGDVEQYIATCTANCARYAEFIDAVNPPKAFIDAAHARGMKAIVWLDIFDEFYPGYRSKFLEEHPECRWWSRDGERAMPGLLSYAFPEARAFRVAQARELLDLGADGIHCSTSAHLRHMPNVHTVDYYGYEQPVVDAFKERYGVDIRTGDFDVEKWHDVKGDFMVQLYRDLAGLCHGRGKELWVGLQLGRYTQLCADPHFSTHAVARYANHWQALVDEGIADAFIVGDYEQVSVPTHPYWTLKTDIELGEGENLYQWAARTYQPHCKGKVRLFTFTEWLNSDPAKLEPRMKDFARWTKDNGFDGVDVHEAMNFERETNWPILARFKAWLDGAPMDASAPGGQ
ncbi:MAG: hypothetical protein JXR94_16325 [Candidatus Hydrogenedentes bacterium]|nr:hypothetical protein [Candidatus Hydrogenedentota bacterium]